jgi:hypothetical protein
MLKCFSPKVIQLAEEAKAEDHARRCSALSDQVQQQLEAGNGEAAVELIKSGAAEVLESQRTVHQGWGALFPARPGGLQDGGVARKFA